jgi:guanine deaminase
MNPAAMERIEFYDPGYLVTEGEKILELTREDPRERYPAAEFIDFADCVIVPGLIDTHVHLSQFAIMGIGSGKLLTWLNTYTYPEESRFADSEYAARISDMFFDELLANGTTAAAVYCPVHEEAADIAFATAVRKEFSVFMGKVMMDQNSPPALQERTGASIASSLRLFEKWDGAGGGRIRYVFTPRFAAACSMDLMMQTGRIAAERGAAVQTHLSENVEEVRWVQRLFPKQPSYAGIYDAAGLLGAHSILAHCIHLSAEEIRLLARRRAHVAFCPYSNRKLSSGTMPYRQLSEAGLNIGLGTDIAGGPTLSMFRQMGEAVMSGTGVTPMSALSMATLGGARALGIEHRAGSLDSGKDADFVVVDARKLDPTRAAGGYCAPEHVLSRLCFAADKPAIARVYVRGRLVYF